jgi:hypothetical protein
MLVVENFLYVENKEKSNNSKIHITKNARASKLISATTTSFQKSLVWLLPSYNEP